MSGTSLQQSPYRPMVRRQEDGDPFMPFRRQMNRLFDDFFTGPMWPRFPMAVSAPVLEVVVTPQIEVSETDKEVHVTAELPGIDPSKVEDKPVLVVTHDTSAKLGLHRISDLATLTSPAVLGAPVDCIGSSTCLRGLEDRYGLRFEL